MKTENLKPETQDSKRPTYPSFSGLTGETSVVAFEKTEHLDTPIKPEYDDKEKDARVSIHYVNTEIQIKGIDNQ
jgi:hypothetical protein